MVELPVREAALTVGFRSPPQDRLLAVATSHPLAVGDHHSDVRYLVIDGLDEPSQMALVWRTDRATPQLAMLARLISEEFSRDGNPCTTQPR
ncbi:hypothetical protein [Streptomyces blastmyceticus]|uniref:hypothetical protein n=1 Tax=Streptomyces blastmyceticus TaxID=68180 RepID=UPI0031D26B2D